MHRCPYCKQEFTPKTYGQTIRAVRVGAGKSIENVAHELGVALSHLSRIERDIYRPSPALADAISTYFDGVVGVPEDYK